MFNSLVTFIRRLDPASEYSIGFERNVDAFSWGQLIHELQGPQNGAYVLWACYGEAVIGEFTTRAQAELRLNRARRESRTIGRIVTHNWWRLVSWAERVAASWPRPASRLDDVIA